METGHSLPVYLPPATEAAVYREVNTATRAVANRHGASHTEVIVDATGWCTVIAIATRLVGGQIGILLRHALGIGIWCSSTSPSPARPHSPRPAARGHATVRFITSPHAGRLRSVGGLPKPGPGAPFVRWRTAIGGPVHTPGANAHRLGSFVVTGPDPAEVEERADALLRQDHLHTEPTAGSATSLALAHTETPESAARWQ